MFDSRRIQAVPVQNWIDVHSHYFPPMSAEEQREMVDHLRKNCWCIDHFDEWTVEKTLDHMDRLGTQMQMLSFVPNTVQKLRRSNDFGAEIVRQHPERFGLLVGLPSDNPAVCLEEIARSEGDLNADGFAMQALYNGVYLSDPRLEPVWAELERRKAVVFFHPNATTSAWDRPGALMEVAFQTAYVIVDMLYAGVFRRHPNIRFIIAHCGGALPAISGRLLQMGAMSWVPNPQNITRDEISEVLGKLFLDTAATMPTTLGAALEMTTADKIVYGSDYGVPCVDDQSIAENIEALLAFRGLTADQIQAIGRNALSLFPKAAARLAAGQLFGDTATK